MPIYEYECRNCGEIYDALRNLHDDDREVECPRCGEKDSWRRISLTVSDANKSPGGCGGGRRGPMRFG
ncbi:zinc ribbon domain-containing protein [candidate division KSB1 bacterium]|nr:MAG: zinc ribbon domain-containing protein [candidate division KSB1 bacterium]